MKKKILIPIDGTERGMKSIEYVKNIASPEDASIILLMVREDMGVARAELDYKLAEDEIIPILNDAANQLPGYDVRTIVAFARAAEHILDISESEKVDMIVMTKSTRKGWHRMIGSVTAHVVKYASCMVVIVPEL
ncbi:MAG: universal stress protein [Clostridiales bacterium]|nr:universal stress protein [Clostridiales bacterium]